MDKQHAYVESAYEARRAQMAEEAVKREAEKMEKAERDALQLATLRDFVALHVPAELMGAVIWPDGGDLYETMGRVTILAPDCVPVQLSVYLGEKRGYFLLEEPWLVPALEIRPPYYDEGDDEVYEGTARIYWGHAHPPYDFKNCKTVKDAIGHARERYLKLEETWAEHKELYEELQAKHPKAVEAEPVDLVALYNLGAEKGNGRVAQDGEHVYVPAPETLTPEEAFGQAFHDYMRYLVGTIMREGQE